MYKLCFGEEQNLYSSVGRVGCFAIFADNLTCSVSQESVGVDVVLGNEFFLHGLCALAAQDVVGAVGAGVVAVPCDDGIYLLICLQKCCCLLYGDESLVAQRSLTRTEVHEVAIGGWAVGLRCHNYIIGLYQSVFAYQQHGILGCFEQSFFDNLSCYFLSADALFGGQSFCSACELCLLCTGCNIALVRPFMRIDFIAQREGNIDDTVVVHAGASKASVYIVAREVVVHSSHAKSDRAPEIEFYIHTHINIGAQLIDILSVVVDRGERLLRERSASFGVVHTVVIPRRTASCN